MNSRKPFWNRTTPITKEEKLFFENLKIEIYSRIAYLLSKNNKLKKMKCFDIDGKEVNGKPLRKCLNFHKTMALYTYYIPLIEHILGRSQPANIMGRKQFVMDVKLAICSVKQNFPYARSGFHSTTKKIMDKLAEYVDAKSYNAPESKPKSSNLPLYRQLGCSYQLTSDFRFIYRLGHFAITHNIPLLENRLFFRQAFFDAEVRHHDYVHYEEKFDATKFPVKIQKRRPSLVAEVAQQLKEEQLKHTVIFHKRVARHP